MCNDGERRWRGGLNVDENLFAFKQSASQEAEYAPDESAVVFTSDSRYLWL